MPHFQWKEKKKKSLTAVTIFGTFAIIALVYFVACDEMGFEMTDSGIVEVQEELSTCVCRVDGDIENPGDGKSWEAACQTVDECVERIEKDSALNKGCEVWVKEGTVIAENGANSSKLGPIRLGQNISVYGKFRGTERSLAERTRGILSNLIESETQSHGKSSLEAEDWARSKKIVNRFIPMPESDLLWGTVTCLQCDNNELGINTESPDSDIHVIDSDDDCGMIIQSDTGKESQVIFNESTTTKWTIYSDGDDSDSLKIKDSSGNDIFIIEQNGDVGINQDWSYAALHVRGDSDSDTALRVQRGNVYIKDPAKVGIGTDEYFSGTTYELAVNGKILAEEIIVDSVTADFVFEPDYDLPSLECVEEHILQHGHLPEIPQADDIEINGLGLGEMSALLLQKVEELTLYTIKQKKEIDAQKEELKRLRELVQSLAERK